MPKQKLHKITFSEIELKYMLRCMSKAAVYNEEIPDMHKRACEKIEKVLKVEDGQEI